MSQTATSEHWIYLPGAIDFIVAETRVFVNGTWTAWSGAAVALNCIRTHNERGGNEIEESVAWTTLCLELKESREVSDTERVKKKIIMSD